MELVNLYIWGSIGAAFCLIVGALIGHAIYDRQQMAKNAVQRDHLSDVTEKWRTLLQEAHAETVAREEQLEDATHSFEFSDKFRKAIVEAVVAHGLWDFDEHGSCPTLMLAKLCNHVAECALDPKQNQKAKNLYVKGVRAGAKKGRAQMNKLYEKRFESMQVTNQMLNVDLKAAQEGYDDLLKRESIYREAVKVTLTDKVGLVGVRRAIYRGIAEECTRLRAVESNKGE